MSVMKEREDKDYENYQIVVFLHQFLYFLRKQYGPQFHILLIHQIFTVYRSSSTIVYKEDLKLMMKEVVNTCHDQIMTISQ